MLTVIMLALALAAITILQAGIGFVKYAVSGFLITCLFLLFPPVL